MPSSFALIPGGKSEEILKYPALSIANEIIIRSKFSVTPMKLQKLMYYAHGWCLGLTGEPLINEPFRAWDYGPVAQTVYNEFRSYGNGRITKPAEYFDTVPRVPETDPHTQKLIEKVLETYGKYDAITLSRMTHEVGSPWDITYNRRSERSGPIDDVLIRAHFRKAIQ